MKNRYVYIQTYKNVHPQKTTTNTHTHTHTHTQSRLLLIGLGTKSHLLELDDRHQFQIEIASCWVPKSQILDYYIFCTHLSRS